MSAAQFDGITPWPAEAAARYVARGHWRGVAIGDVFDESVRTNADREAIIDGERRVTYRELGRMVDLIAIHFAACGISAGKRVVFQLPNCLECVVAYFACLKVGAIQITCLPAHRHTDIEHLARFTGAYAWLTPADHRRFDHVAMAEELRGSLPAMRELIVVGERAGPRMTRFADLLGDRIEERVSVTSLARLKPDAGMPAVFQLSGGSTGLPKVIPRTHNDYLYNSYLLSSKSGYDRDGVALVAIPMLHNFPLAGAVQPGLLLGGKVVLAQGPEPARRVLNEIGPVVTQVYGMAEGLCCSTRAGDPEEVVVETQGRPMSEDDEIRIVDEDDRDVPPGELGELLTRGPYTIRGYYNAEEHNRASFTPDGYYRIGDVVRMHRSGNLIVEGRRKDLINRGGEKISAEEIENLILSHPAVENTAVVAMPDAVLGERACAYVVLRPSASLDLGALTRFLEKKRIARFKLPERLEVIERLPATAVGKISKKDLRDDIQRKLARERGSSS